MSNSTSTPSSSSTKIDSSLDAISPTKTAKDRRAERLRELQSELEELKVELGAHDPHEIVQTHIKLLHEYNEIKDGTQALIGKYAQLTNRTVREIHQEMGLPLTD
ncbi:hypothetical protein I302_108629 [Kwoniella bestiolae CBS 10118]|uniref:DNA repair protein Swi5/Sae3 n=1 Tax=Kwoniella bestiolae CBS 10118 TaxID=1296100 RepID=A0A1B9FTL8_9TREE|nr:DNA repair protein Swi5/Sae3 [Kwoniella bestiolae CBS 10118]OCF22124.1 DNA repair protein Swi5/Sae3 [Kwoniella bestiolae CBS 10118]